MRTDFSLIEIFTLAELEDGGYPISEELRAAYAEQAAVAALNPRVICAGQPNVIRPARNPIFNDALPTISATPVSNGHNTSRPALNPTFRDRPPTIPSHC